MSQNQLVGLLSPLANAMHLMFLDVSLNRFTGSIPEALQTSGSLEVLSLFMNQLTGPVNLSNTSALEAFFAFENKLSVANSCCLPIIATSGCCWCTLISFRVTCR